MERLIIQVAIGYMLKVMKSDKLLDFQKNEFAAIRHGNYDQFLSLANGPIPEMVVYNAGVIKTKNISQKGDFDFAALIKAGPSLLIFHKKCLEYYGNFKDKEIDDNTFEKIALFEIGLRMHANNKTLLIEMEKFESVIDKLGAAVNMSQEEINQLHFGRQLLNMIKHKKMKFDTWESGIKAFLSVSLIVDKYKLKVI
jgi:hypothetical protein